MAGESADVVGLTTNRGLHLTSLLVRKGQFRGERDGEVGGSTARTLLERRTMTRHLSRFAVTAFVASTVFAESASASADDAPVVVKSASNVAPLPTKRTNWYGWQTFIAVGASTSLVITGGIVGGDAGGNTVGVGLVGLGVSAPIVHWAHGHIGSGFRAIGLNVGMSLGGALLGILTIGPILREAGVGEGEPAATTMFSSNNTAANLGADIGAGLGYLGATTIDALVYCREEVQAEPSVPKKSSRTLPVSFAIVPAMVKDHIGLRLVG